MMRPARQRLLPAGEVPPRDPFASHPLRREVQRERSIARLLGLRDPYYRVRPEQSTTRACLDGRALRNFASYDYLGLNGHPEVLAAHGEAARRWGTSVSGSRLTSGERPIHGALEAALAAFHGLPASVAFVSGHAGAVSVISTLMGPRDLVVHDELAHNSLVMGAQASRAARVVFRHNDLAHLDEQLRRLRHLHERALIVSEGLFSMSGDGPDLRELVRLKERHGAWLMMDEAHALGVLGATGRGSFEQLGVEPGAVDIWMGTLSKTLASCGGYIAGSRALVDMLRHTLPGFVYSVGLAPPLAAAAARALELLHAEPWRVARLQANARHFRDAVRAAGFDTGRSCGLGIVPVILGDSLATLQVAAALVAAGVNVQPICFPVVPDGEARLRFFLSAGHETAELDRSVEALRAAMRAVA